jgi:cytochrome c peroxidase
VRAAPTLWNVGFLNSFFWDGRSASLEDQALGPLFAPDEMGNTRDQIESTLSANETYRALFAQVYGANAQKHITTEMVVQALAAFESTLISLNSRYDRYAHGAANALTDIEQQGHSVFRSFVARCSQCHTPPLFTNQQLAVIGAPEPNGRALDPGAGPVVDVPELRGAFKVPTLRNIDRTAPYMHSGSFASLTEVVDFYNAERGHAVPPGEDLLIHWHIASPDLSPEDVRALVAFLGTLTDETARPVIPHQVPSGLPIAPGEQALHAVTKEISP